MALGVVTHQPKLGIHSGLEGSLVAAAASQLQEDLGGWGWGGVGVEAGVG